MSRSSRDRRDAFKPLTKEELAALKKCFEAMDDNTVLAAYRANYRVCEFKDRIPAPQFVQELVVAWRALWKRRR